MMNQSLWYKNTVFYELYIRSFYDTNNDGHGDLRGVIAKLDYLQELGITCIWLLPMYPSPLKDDGYDISDYYNIHPDYGTLDDFKKLVEEVHARGMRIITDLVLNHTSDQHPWFLASRSSKDNPFRDYYVWSDTDKKYEGVRLIFGDVETSNWAWDEATGQYYWHRFYSSQPDLNFDNPAVQEGMLNVVRFWLKLGVDGFRVDAPTYLFEREGTNCESLPETHAYLKRIRAVINKEFPGRIILAESNQQPRELVEYFGNGTDEFHMAFNFPLMTRIFLALAEKNSNQIRTVFEQMPETAEETQWAIFLRNHDELTLEMASPEERQHMYREYAPDPKMILNLGLRRRLAPLLQGDRRRIELANALILSLPGTPVLYYGDEIGMGENLNLADRNGVRTPMQWDDSVNAGFSTAKPFSELVQGEFGYQQINVASQVSDPDSLFRSIKRMIAIRKEHTAFGSSSIKWIETGNPTVTAYLREHNGDTLLIFNNLSDSTQVIEIPVEYQKETFDVFTAQPYSLSTTLELKPYSYRWLQL
ncbi:MAG: maltose alpha-D-glucosyltransferase [Anaerolineales bacterium]